MQNNSPAQFEQYQLQAKFAQAVALAQSNRPKEAYFAFKELTHSPLGNWNPNVWLWLARLTKDLDEGKAALRKAQELGPLHTDLGIAQQDFKKRVLKILLWRRISLITTLICIPLIIILTVVRAEVWPLSSAHSTGLYLRQWLEADFGNILYFLAFLAIITAHVITSNLAPFQSPFKKFSNIALGIFLAVAIIAGFSLGANQHYLHATYHNKVKFGNTVYQLESFGQIYYDYTSSGTPGKPNFYIYKCENSGWICEKPSLVDNRPTAQQGKLLEPEYYSYINQRQYRLKYNAGKSALEIFSVEYYYGNTETLINSIPLN